MRIGQGIDVHRFGAQRPLLLCGVEVPHDQGLIAHSDGDVALHALCDALLGAAALGDIGRHFPDTDVAWKDADSRGLLREVVRLVRDKGYEPHNLDLTLVAQKPRLAPYIPAMVALIAEDLGIESGQVNVKATTTEQLGFTGRGEGIAAFAVVLLDD
jgi:2-C-methyl-D-erythritol 2,4-cyclodiphosphate synthase